MGGRLAAGVAEIDRPGRTQVVCICVAALTAAGLAHAPRARADEAEQAPVATFETVVTAAPPGKGREDDTAVASVITADRTPRAAETLPQLLSELPGVAVTRFGGLGAHSTLSLRGSSANQVQVYVDGVPLTAASAAIVDLGLLPLTGVDRIEVYRGASPLAFGSSAMGGVLSITSAPPERSGLGARAGLGSFGTRLLGADAAWAGARAQASGSVNVLSSRGDYEYLNDNGTLFNPRDDRRAHRENNALVQGDAALRGGLRLGGARRLAASLFLLRRAQGLPGAAQLRSTETSLETDRAIASAGYDGADDLGPGGRVRARAYGVLTEQRFADPLGELASSPTATRDVSSTLGATAEAKRHVRPWLRLSGVVDVRRERFSPHETIRARRDALAGGRLFGAAGLEADLWAPALDLDVIPSARVELARDDVAKPATISGRPAEVVPARYALPILRLGLVQRPRPGLALRANVGRYARLPTMMERYGTGGLVTGNPDLVPERGLNADLGAGWLFERGAARLRADGALFGALSRDLVAFQPGAYVGRYRNVGRARTLGGEAALALLLHDLVHLLAQATYADVRDTSGSAASDGKQLPLRPRLRGYGRAELRGLPVGRYRAGLHADVDLTSGNHLDPANLVSVPARVLLGAGASFADSRSGLRLVATAQNLADARINDVQDLPLPGRALFVTLEWAAALSDPVPPSTSVATKEPPP
jgi:iron complex outermembrane receptor protein